MKRVMYLSLLIMLVGACATIGTPSKEVLNNRKNLKELSKGITKRTVIDIMGPHYLESLFIVNIPKKGKIVSTKDKKYEVLCYRINDHQLPPSVYDYTYYNTVDKDIDTAIDFRDSHIALVFDQDRLIGWGKEFLAELGENQE